MFPCYMYLLWHYDGVTMSCNPHTLHSVNNKQSAVQCYIHTTPITGFIIAFTTQSTAPLLPQ